MDTKTYVILVTLPTTHADGDAVDGLDAENIAARNWQHHTDGGDEVPAVAVTAERVGLDGLEGALINIRAAYAAL